MSQQKDILYCMDAIGVSDGMLRIFNYLSQERAVRVSLYATMKNSELLSRYRNRKAPAFTKSLEVRKKIHAKLTAWVIYYQPRVIVISDPAMLFLLDSDPDFNMGWLTIDNLRGGVYSFKGIPVVVTYPVTAWFREIRERDIASANDGFETEDAFTEAAEDESAADSNTDETKAGEAEDSKDEHEEKIFYAPIMTKVQVGKFTLTQDWKKVFRLANVNERYVPTDAELQTNSVKLIPNESLTTQELSQRLRKSK